MEKQQKEESGGFFSNLFSSKKSKKEEVKNGQIQGLNEQELDNIQISIRQILADSSSASEDAAYLQLSEAERAKQVRFNANFIFKRGRINLIDQMYKVELYQDDLSLKLDFRRDTTFEIKIGNRSVGLNLIDQYNVVKEIVVRQELP